MSAAVAHRYECLDVDCGEVIVASDRDELVARVQAHMADAHDSFELEDVIIDTSTEVPDGEDGETQEDQDG
jgi:predicted small metal-binding protein